MADDGSENNDKTAASGGGKGALGELVKAESMIQLAIALPAGCVIGWLVAGNSSIALASPWTTARMAMWPERGSGATLPDGADAWPPSNTDRVTRSR